MIGVLVLTHGELGHALVRTLAGIVGETPGMDALAITPHAAAEDIRKAVAERVTALDSGKGVLILTDMFGGTPANISLSFLSPERVEVLTGVNLPMLLKLSTLTRENRHLTEKPLSEIARLIQEYGQKNISLASDLLQRRRPGTATAATAPAAATATVTTTVATGGTVARS